MKLTLHIPSVLVGVAALGVTLLVLGAQKSPITYKWPVEKSLRIEGVPTPGELWDYTRPKFTPAEEQLGPLEVFHIFTVPSDKILVIRRVEFSVGSDVLLYDGIGGVPQSRRFDEHNSATLPDGLAFTPGTDVLLYNEDDTNAEFFGHLTLFGYLADA